MNTGILTEGAFGAFDGTSFIYRLPILTEGSFSPFVIVAAELVDLGIIADGIKVKFTDGISRRFSDMERR